MSKQKVFLVGATGETGSSILEALMEDESFDVTCFIRTASLHKPAAQHLKSLGIKVVVGNLDGPTQELASLLRDMDTVISTIFPPDARDQIPLINAAVEADVKRFLPCNWGTPVARGGIMDLHDLKEEVHDHIFSKRLGFTIIDVGYWYQSSFPLVPSGRFDYAAFAPLNELYAGGTAPNMLMDRGDVGRITARIIKDPRTLNKRVFAYGDLLTQNEIHTIIEEKTGEKIEALPKSVEEIYATLEAGKKEYEDNPTDIANLYKMVGAQYSVTKFVREDNTPENAEYLGYINGRELYPDFEFRTFADFVDELIAGKARRIYPHVHL